MRRAKSRISRIQAACSILALGCIFIQTVPASAEVTHSETVEKEIKPGEARTIVIEGVNGSISVTGEKGRESIFLKVIKRVHSDDLEEAKKIASLMEIEVSRPGDIIKIETLYPKKYKVKRSLLSMVVDKHPNMMMELTILVPEDFEVAATTASGAITIVDIRSSVEVSVSSGEANIREIGGDAEVNVTSGQIKAVKVAGDAVLKVTSGKIAGKNIGGNVKCDVTTGKLELLQTGGDLGVSIGYGEVIVEGVGAVEYRGVNAEADFIDVRGAVDASTASGNILIRALPEGDNNYKITASSGQITLRFLEAMEGGYVLKVGTTSGTINVDLPIDLKKVARNSIYGIVRGGKGKVFLESASGDITIEEPGE
ncbi:MAG: DUF4097 family beta strand repeat protein [Candidatus Krumholzibacteriota bacterium]|nr:DUF4097 family beta strand repeat protein [Candidatus Krumholzibacteriota bacterium]